MTLAYYVQPDFPEGLQEWLAKGRNWDIEYGGYLSNHMTHNWIVLGAINASDEQMQWWEDLYTNKLKDKPAREPADLDPPRPYDRSGPSIFRGNWRKFIEDGRTAYLPYRHFFDRWIGINGREEVVREFLPFLLPGLAGAALHPVIHAGWGLDAGSDEMVAEGLAYMATAFQPLAGHTSGFAHCHRGDAQAGPIAASVEILMKARSNGWAQISHEASQTDRYKAIKRGSFQHRIIAFNDPELPLYAGLNSVAPPFVPLDEGSLLGTIEECVALITAALKGSGGEFFVLHGLTSLHAILTLLPHLDPDARRDALIYWWRAAMATLIVQSMPGLDRTVELLEKWQKERATNVSSMPKRGEFDNAWWLAQLQKASPSHDEHLPKAIYVLWRWSAWRAFSDASERMMQQLAAKLVTDHPSGQLHENLWFSRGFSKASAKREAASRVKAEAQLEVADQRI